MRQGKQAEETGKADKKAAVQNVALVSPHIHDGSNTRRIMLDVIISLIPALIAATILFGPMVLLLTVATISAAVLFEWLFQLVAKRDTSSVFDLTAVVTGLILVLGIPSTVPLWMSAAGAGAAIIIAKHFFGGVGRNLINPALVGHFVIVRLARRSPDYIGYPNPMAWMESLSDWGADVMTSATPLQLLVDGETLPGLGELFLGIHPGAMGETSILALLLGAAYLLWRRVISPAIPFAYIGTAMLIVALNGHDPLVHLFSGSLVFVAFFMATDYATSPNNLKGKIIFGIGCGLITAQVRLGGGSTEGVTTALLLMNLLVPLINWLTFPKAFGR